MLHTVSKCNRWLYEPLLKTVRCYRTSVKNVPGKTVRRRERVSDPNPGIERQLKILDQEERENVEEDFNEESDFMNVDKMHELYEKEKKDRKKNLQHWMVGHKYFRPEPGPNLLTWAEKEQIRHLHESDRDKWSIEKLAQSFPASQETIKKILKTRWSPRDSTRIVKHDQVVERNWQLLKTGELDIDPELKQHLAKFTERCIPSAQHVPDPAADERWRPKPKKNEFGSIIESYKRLKSPETVESKTTSTKHEQPKRETYVMQGDETYSRHGHATLETYRSQVQKALDRGRDASAETKFMLQSTAAESSILQSQGQHREIEMTTEPRETTVSNDPPNRIKIPKEKWHRGSTYKVGDSYYDYDGHFLYRVPGMK